MKDSFEKVYMEEKKSIITAAKKYSRELHIDTHEMESLLNFEFWQAYTDYDDSIGKVAFTTFYSRRLKQRAHDAYRKKERRFYESAERIDKLGIDKDDGSAAMFEIVDDFNLAEEVIEGLTRKKKNDQRMLIEFLVSGENERTTAIVQTYLSTELKTPTAIGKHLGLDHKQVSRALNRLAGKFSTKQHGNYHDYLVAL